ncbi:hypothetical protein Bbelb_302240 [Branchiostoma belcheri]|nr:hypothetical protein Bbelb_302240 [Branchiostoma belcheri]
MAAEGYLRTPKQVRAKFKALKQSASAKRIKSGRRRHLQPWRARPTFSPVASDDVTRAGHLRTGRCIGQAHKVGPPAPPAAVAARPTFSPVASDDVTRAGHLRTGRSPISASASAKRIKSGRRRHLQPWRARPTFSPVASDDVTRAGHLRRDGPRFRRGRTSPDGTVPDFGELEAQRPKFLRLADACRRKIPVGRITAGPESLRPCIGQAHKVGPPAHLQPWRARPTFSPVASDDVTRAGHLRTGRCIGQAHKVGPPAPPAAVAARPHSHLLLVMTSPGPDISGRDGPRFRRVGSAAAQILRLADACLGYTSPRCIGQAHKVGPPAPPAAVAGPTNILTCLLVMTSPGPDISGRDGPLFGDASAKRIKSGRRRHLQPWRARPTFSPVASDDVTRAGHLRTGRSPISASWKRSGPNFLRLADACASAKRIKSGRRRHLQPWRPRPTFSPVASDDVTRAGHLRTGRCIGQAHKVGPPAPPAAVAGPTNISPVASDDVTRAGHLRTGRSPISASASAKRIKSGRRRHLQPWRARPTFSPVASDDVTRAGHLRTGRCIGQAHKVGPPAPPAAVAGRPTFSPVASDDVTRAGHLRTGRSPISASWKRSGPNFLRLADACASAKRIKSGRRRHLQPWRARPTFSPVASDDVTRAGHLRTGRSPISASASAKRIKSGRRRHLQPWRARPTFSPVASDDVTRAGHLRTGRSPISASWKRSGPNFALSRRMCIGQRIKSGRRRHLQPWRARPTFSPVASDDVTRAGHLRTGRSPISASWKRSGPNFLRLADACASAKRIKSGRRRHLQPWRADQHSHLLLVMTSPGPDISDGTVPDFGELEAAAQIFALSRRMCIGQAHKVGPPGHLQPWRARPTFSPVASDDVTRAGHLRTGRCIGQAHKVGPPAHLQPWRARPTFSPVASDDVTRAGHLRTGRSPISASWKRSGPNFLRLADACASAKRIKSGRRRHLQPWRARPTFSPVASDDVTRAGHLRTGRSPISAIASAKRIKSGRRRHLQPWRARPTFSPVASDDVTRAGHLRTGRSPISASASAKRIKSGRRRHLQPWRARPTFSPVASDDVTRAGHLRTGRCIGQRIKSGRRRHLQPWRARPTFSPVASDDVTRAGHLRTGRSPISATVAARPTFHLLLVMTSPGPDISGRDGPDFGELEAQRPKFLRLADACASAKRIKSGRGATCSRGGRPHSNSHCLLVMTSPGPDISDGTVPDFGELEAQRPKFLRLADALGERFPSGG